MTTSEMKQSEESKKVLTLSAQSELTVSKEIKFEAAHRLVHGYPGNCQHIHGHSWVAIITVAAIPSSENADYKTLNKFGFVQDYANFKPVKNWVDDVWDHAFLVADCDTEMIQFLQENNQRHAILPHNPTSEIVAQILYRKSSVLLNTDTSRVVQVRLKETCTSEAVYREAK